jgi:hypothetical protein
MPFREDHPVLCWRIRDNRRLMVSTSPKCMFDPTCPASKALAKREAEKTLVRVNNHFSIPVYELRDDWDKGWS